MTEKEYIERYNELLDLNSKVIEDMMDLSDEFIQSLPFRIGDYVEVNGGVTKKSRRGWIGFIAPEPSADNVTLKLELFRQNKSGKRSINGVPIIHVPVNAVTVLKGGDHVGE